MEQKLPVSKEPVHRTVLQFDDNMLVHSLFGEHGKHLNIIEEATGVELASRGNEVMLIGPKRKIKMVQEILDLLWKRLNQGLDVSAPEVDAAIMIAKEGNIENKRLALLAFRDSPVKLKAKSKNREIVARSPTQAKYLDAIAKNDVVFGIGPAGTGKTYLAVAQAVSMLVSGQVEKLILTRPAVEAGENLGFLPGDLKEKVDPYLRPIYDALHDMLSPEQTVRKIAEGAIEIAPLAYMRGRTLSNAFIILDEAQNTTATQMKMALTRIGEGSKMVVTGDPSQVDLPYTVKSGLRDAIEVLPRVDGVAMITFNEGDVVRSKVVKNIVSAYDTRDKNKNPSVKDK
jgi:phosphate starvation-inducible PhoH-like protein